MIVVNADVLSLLNGLESIIAYEISIAEQYIFDMFDRLVRVHVW